MSGIFGFLARRFIAGDNIEEALQAVERLNSKKITTTLDILGENVSNKEEAVAKADAYIELLDHIHRSAVTSHASIKLTQMGLDISDQFCFDNVSRIFERAQEYDIFIRVDMEGSDYTQRTLDLVYRWHEIYPNMGTVIQAMLHRSEDDVKELNRQKIKVRLCKGAYKEPASLAFQDKKQVNKNYAKLTKMLLSDGVYPAIATHDDKLIEYTKQFAAESGIGRDQFEFQMLYGIRRKLQEQITSDGYRMRVYVPYGTHWFPYYYRRLRERKENIFFILKNLFKD
ncbi:MAG: proline dehydrogenase [candidate division Zixibacteria bacterium]|nr:proline dehydrogenase [candidate division Zixibacteria bacterium]